MTTTTHPLTLPFKKFLVIFLLVSIWVNASEVVRYFLVVIPEMRSFLSMVPNIAPMDLGIFSIWGIWDSILTGLTVFMYYLYSEKFGRSNSSILISGTLSWAFFFVLYWIAMPNQSLASWSFILIPLVWAWVELVVASYIANVLFKKFLV
jgi:hypothetical protein